MAFWWRDWRIVVGMSLSGWDVALYSRFYEFNSCAHCCCKVFAKIPYLPLALKIAFLWSSPKIHDHRGGSEQRPIVKLTALCVLKAPVLTPMKEKLMSYCAFVTNLCISLLDSLNNNTLLDPALTVYPFHTHYEGGGESTRPCRSPTPTVNSCDLTPEKRTQTFEQEYSDLTTSNKRVISILLPQHSPQFFARDLAQAFQIGFHHIMQPLQFLTAKKTSAAVMVFSSPDITTCVSDGMIVTRFKRL